MSLEKRINILKESIITDQELVEKLLPFENFYKAFGQFEHFFISKSILEKILFLKKQIIDKPDNFLLNFSTLRFMLETLIHSKLLLMEREYIYFLFYSIYDEQITKTENFISRLKYEIDLIEKYNQEEKSVKSKIKLTKKSSEEQIRAHFESIKEIEKEIDARAEKELTIFWGDFEFMGYFAQKHFMENEFMEKYMQQLDHLRNLKNEKAKDLFQNEKVKAIFKFKDENDVFIKLKEKRRTWKGKAELTGYLEEYKLVYEITSATLHSSSYSIITTPETNEQEQIFALQLIKKYSNVISDNIFKFLDFDKTSTVKVINV